MSPQSSVFRGWGTFPLRLDPHIATDQRVFEGGEGRFSTTAESALDLQPSSKGCRKAGRMLPSGGAFEREFPFFARGFRKPPEPNPI
ncbi:MAG: hypothetical protein C0511_00740 [Hyphomicrobium sp.]|nr:hypothetical protein [Hyphomicrobium sp.]PPC84130.1 MAG: hypothetical protein CTY40_00740 [Hyphomicrobium sp.]